MTPTRPALFGGSVVLLLCTCGQQALSVDYAKLLSDPVFVFGDSTTAARDKGPGARAYGIFGKEATGVASVYAGGLVVDATKLSPSREIQSWETIAPHILDFVRRTWPTLELRQVSEQPDAQGMYSASFGERKSGLNIRTLSLSVACWNGRICHLQYREEIDWLGKALPPMPATDAVRAACLDALMDRHPELKGLALVWVDLRRFWARPTQTLYWIGTLRCERDTDALAIGVTLTDDLRPIEGPDCVELDEIPKPRLAGAESTSSPFIGQGGALGWVTTAAVRGFPAWSIGHESILVPRGDRLVALRPVPYGLYSPATYQKVTWLPADRLLVTAFPAGAVGRAVYLVDMARMTAAPLARNLPEHYHFTSTHAVHPGDDFALAVAENRQTGKRNLCFISLVPPDRCELLDTVPGSSLSFPAVGPSGLICYATCEADQWQLRTAHLAKGEDGRPRLDQGDVSVQLPGPPRQMEWSHDSVLILTTAGRLLRIAPRKGAVPSAWEVRHDGTRAPLQIRSVAGSPVIEVVGACAFTAEAGLGLRVYSIGRSGIARAVPDPETPVEYLGDVRQMTAPTD